MSLRSRLAAPLAAVAAALPAVALAQHPGEKSNMGDASAQIVIRATAVDPPRITALTGEHVEWLNASVRDHTATSRDGLFDSGPMRPGRRFGHTFAAAGSFGYYCRIHPFITGAVDVADVLLRAPAGPVVRGDALMLEGRARPAGAAVTIERDTGTGFAAVATVMRAADGKFSARLLPDAPASYRAVSGPDVSPPVRIVVVPARTVTVTVQRGPRRQLIRVAVNPALPGGTVRLQRYVKERFGWWTTRREGLAGGSSARIRLPRGMKGPARVVVTQPDGETTAVVSAVLRLRG